MAETTKYQGKDIAVYIDDYIVGCALDGTLTITTSFNSTVTKCSASAVTGVLWQRNTPNVNSATLSGNGLVPRLASSGYDEISVLQLNRAIIRQQRVFVEWRDTTGNNDYYYNGYGYLSTVSSGAPAEGEATYDFEITFDGEISDSPAS